MSTTQLIGIQRRFMRLGKIRLGDKGPKGEPRKLAKFRLTSASLVLLEAAAAEYGGEVRDWAGSPDEGVFELYTDTDTLDIILPPVFSDRDGSPTLPYSQAYEMWTAGGCVRRCDGETEILSNKPCLCDPEERECKIVTRLNVLLSKLPGLGVWLMESHGYNAAAMIPGTLDLLMLAAARQQFIPAVLRLEQRTSKKGGQTRKFVVPVIDLPELRMADVLQNGLTPGSPSPGVINAPSPRPPRPALPAGEPLPGETERFANDDLPEFGEPPEIVDVVPTSIEELACQTARDELLALVTELGATDSLPKIAEKYDAGDTAWLKRQITTAKKHLAARESAGEPDGTPVDSPDTTVTAESSPAEETQESFFAERAAKAHSARESRRSRSRS